MENRCNTNNNENVMMLAPMIFLGNCDNMKHSYYVGGGGGVCNCGTVDSG